MGLSPAAAGVVDSQFRHDLGKVIGINIQKGAYVSVGDDGVTRILTQGSRYEVDARGNVREFKRICDKTCKNDPTQKNANRFALIGVAAYGGKPIAHGHVSRENMFKLSEILAKVDAYKGAMNVQIGEEAKAAGAKQKR